MSNHINSRPGVSAEVIDLLDSESEDGSGNPESVSLLQKETCLSHVLSVFDDICPTHLAGLAEVHNHNAEIIVALIVDQQENGNPYPKRENTKKRKRGENNSPAVEESAAIRAKLHDPDYNLILTTSRYKDMAVTLIAQDFPRVPKNTIKNLLAEHGSSVFHTYTTMDEAARNGEAADRLWIEKKTATKIDTKYSRQNIDDLLHGDLHGDLSADEMAALQEFVAARRIREEHDTKSATEAEENANKERAIMNGQVVECGCCLDDEVPLNRVVQCDGEEAHTFCRPCMRKQAESQIGYQKYQLTCMSMDGCQAGFSASQRRTFLDEKLQIALDRIEQQAMLEMAGIESLETCPFCPFAMEYPPVEENKEFRCANTDCEVVSCRLCRKVTHIPKTCAEAAAEEGHEARHTIEEAMSEAMIRRCNSCKNPFIKQDGCNKITCTRCRTIQCYVCRQTVKGYDHFNDASRGGKEGQCPLFDATEERHEAEVQRAQEEMRKKVAEENPDLDDTALDIKVSDKVQEDDLKRKERDPRYQHGVRGGRHFPLNFLGAHPLVLPLVNAAPLRPGHANAPGPEAQRERDNGGRNIHQPQRLGQLHAAQRAHQHIVKHLDRKKNLLAQLANQAPFARPGVAQEGYPPPRQHLGYQGGMARPAPLNLPPYGEAAAAPAVRQNALDGRAHLGRPPYYHPLNDNNNDGGQLGARPQMRFGREHVQAQPGFRRYTEIAQRLFGNDQPAAAAADGRVPNHRNRQREFIPGNAEFLRDRGIRQEEPQDAFFMGDMPPDIFDLMGGAQAFPHIHKPEAPPMPAFFDHMDRMDRMDRVDRMAAVNRLLRNSEQPEQRAARQFGSVRRQAAPQVNPGPAAARGVQNNRA